MKKSERQEAQRDTLAGNSEFAKKTTKKQIKGNSGEHSRRISRSGVTRRQSKAQ